MLIDIKIKLLHNGIFLLNCEDLQIIATKNHSINNILFAMISSGENTRYKNEYAIAPVRF